MKDWTGNKKSVFTTIGAAGHANHARQSEDYYRLCMCPAVGLNVPGTEILRNLTKVQQPMLGFSGRRDLKIKR